MSSSSPAPQQPVAMHTARRSPNRRRWRFVALGTLAALVLGIAGYGVAGGLDANATQRVHGSGTKVVRVALVDAVVGFDVNPDTLVVDRGAHLVLDVVNEGGEVHDLAVRGGAGTRKLNPGESDRLDLGPITEATKAVCTLPNHDFAGMALDIRVAGT